MNLSNIRTNHMLNRYLISLSFAVIIYILNLISIPIIISFSSASSYGEYVLLLNYLVLLVAFSPLGTGFIFKRELPSADSKITRGELFYPQFFVNLSLVLIFSFLFHLILQRFGNVFFDSGISLNFFYIILFGILYTIYSQIGFIFKFSENVVFYNSHRFVYLASFLFFVFLLFFFLETLDLKILISAQILSLILTCLIFMFFAINIVGFTFALYKVKDLLKDIRFGFPLLLVAVVEILMTSSDRFVIAAFMDSTDVAYYAVAYTVASLILILPKIFTISLEPRVMSLIDSGNKSEIRQVIKFSLSLFYLLAIPAIFASYIFGREVITLFINEEFGENSSFILPILVISMFFYGTSMILSSLLIALLKTKILFLFNLIVTILNLVLNIIFFLIFKDIVVAAISSLISFFLLHIMIYKNIFIYEKIYLYDQDFLKILFAAFFSFLAVSFLVDLIPEVRIILFTLIFIFTYVLFLVIFRSFVLKQVYNQILKK